MSAHSIGYVALLRSNRPFRHLWYGQIVSQLGDWFNSIALYTLLLRLTGSGQAVGLLLVAELLPATLVGPWAGVLVDRLPRKHLMVLADVGRALLALLFLLVRDVGDIWIVYLVTVLKVVLAALFEPARSAVIPAVTTREELVPANAISGATWSAMLAIGAALGGLVAGTLGTDAAFVIDAASFLLSGVIIWRIPIREEHLGARPTTSGVQELAEGVAYLRSRRDVALYALAKALWSLGGGVLVLLTLFGRQIFPVGADGALSIGLLYAARGVGAAIGPLLAQRLGGASQTFLRRMIGPSILCSALGYLLMSAAPSLWLAALAVMLAHMGGSTQWVFSTVLLQLNVPNRLLGRVFAAELALLTLATAASSYVTGVAADAGWEPRALAVALALVFVPPGLLLLLALWRRPRPSDAPEPVTG
ncbi:MAG: MFS transporter [Chloroflexota bacterium]